MSPKLSPLLLAHFIALSFLASATPCLAAPPAEPPEIPFVVYSTGFEASEGFNLNLSLRGQNGWVGDGSGGNGILESHFEDLGQAAYIGFDPPAIKDYDNLIWRPLNFAPIPARHPLVRFTVWMQIIDSSNGKYDDFRWSIYNSDGRRLFTIDFDNSTLDISYAIEGADDFTPTGYRFESSGSYLLEVTLNFARNLWSADLGGVNLVNAVPITTANAKLELGDVDAVWSIREPGFPGDNYMVFDEYIVTAYPLATMPPRIQQFGIQTDGSFLFRAIGEPGVLYVLEDSVDLIEWLPVAADVAPADGIVEYTDPDPRALDQRYFRIRTFEI